eukprot:Stramenopile-MAST_4_protein_1165
MPDLEPDGSCTAESVQSVTRVNAPAVATQSHSVEDAWGVVVAGGTVVVGFNVVVVVVGATVVVGTFVFGQAGGLVVAFKHSAGQFGE